ncbi:class I SAM-dependent methyltransferase [Frankia sp. AgB32]|uniref:class I SAM-dependent methyltransferase n=1 Tax=Frankia sp. AgB32 TaxID=631119 RepID=UPI00200E43ED|nr:class I SAM-dependent methyltransferase [Frankia sp. AgB32]MCK9895742.1 class I SAM-dependent methyltransferase [Frankia sp. AgB32]
MDSVRQADLDQRARWNGLAGRAWVDAREVLDAMFRTFADLLVDSVTVRRESVVLDVGCGTGGTTLAVARRLAPPGRCTGIDISEPMIAAARERAEQAPAPVDFICADVQDHPFAPGTFDVIFSRFGVMFFDAPVRAFTALRRIARDGAELRFVSWRHPDANPFMTTAERAAAPYLSHLPTREPDAPGQFAFADRHRVGRILAQSGWADVDIRPVDAECVFPERALVDYFTRFGPLGSVFGQLDENDRAAVVETVRAAFDGFVRDAEVRFTAACWLVVARAPAASDIPEQ